MWSVLIFSLMSLVCASAWNLHSLMLFRAIQGFGLGGEVPIAATYINEMSRADTRGRFFMMYESVFMVGIILSSIAGAVIVPNFGWQYLFAICALPALLCVFLQRLVPESPRWLVSRGRLDDAENAVARIQREIEAEGKQIPPPQTLPEIAAAPELIARRSHSLFKGMYLSRTLSLWMLWFCIYFVAYGTLTWFPSIIRSQFGLSLRTSLYMAVGLNALNFIALGFAAFMIDRIGRKLWFAVASLLCAAGMLVLWAFGLSTAGLLLALVGSVTNMSSGFILYLYTPELYPTHNRSIGVAAATCWGRIAAIIGPYAIGLILTAFGLRGVYLMFGVTALVGAVTAALYGVRTEGRALEEISP
jgi:putative MFS transporter